MRKGGDTNDGNKAGAVVSGRVGGGGDRQRATKEQVRMAKLTQELNHHHNNHHHNNSNGGEEMSFEKKVHKVVELTRCLHEEAENALQDNDNNIDNAVLAIIEANTHWTEAATKGNKKSKRQDSFSNSHQNTDNFGGNQQPQQPHQTGGGSGRSRGGDRGPMTRGGNRGAQERGGGIGTMQANGGGGRPNGGGGRSGFGSGGGGGRSGPPKDRDQQQQQQDSSRTREHHTQRRDHRNEWNNDHRRGGGGGSGAGKRDRKQQRNSSTEGSGGTTTATSTHDKTTDAWAANNDEWTTNNADDWSANNDWSKAANDEKLLDKVDTFVQGTTSSSSICAKPQEDNWVSSQILF